MSGLHGLPVSTGAVYVALGSPPDIVRLFGMFAAGMSFYLWREFVVYSHKAAAGAYVSLPFRSSLRRSSTWRLQLAADILFSGLH
jgi:hypothetical protein